MIDPQEVRNLEPRNLSAILDEAFRIYSKNFLRFITIAAIVQVPVTVINLASYLNIPGLNILSSILGLIVSIVFYPIMQGSLIYAISEQNFRQPAGYDTAYRFAWARKGSLILATLIASIAFSLMFITIIGIPLAIFFGVRWSLILQVATLENVGPTEAISRSTNLVKGDWWRVLVYIIIMIIISISISIGAGIFMGLLPLPVVLSTFIWAMINILIFPITTAIMTLIYWDLRVRKEGYNLEKLSQELEIQDTHQHYRLD